MKKFFTILLSLASIASFGQRSCDVSTAMASPTGGSTIKSGVAFNINYTATNNGPGSLLAGDTVLWALAINNTIVNGSAFFKVLTADVPSGSTLLMYNQNVTLTIPANATNADFCALVTAYNRGFGVAKVTDPTPTNNLGCSKVNMQTGAIKSIGNGISVATDVTASPNPANDFVNVSYTLFNPATVTVTLFDMSGRMVVEPQTDKQGAGSNSMQINTSELNSGLYFYEVKIGNQTERYKLMVN